MIQRIILTLMITYLYCNLWILLERIIDGKVIHRTVDDIIMLLFVPIIYIATKSIVN